MIALTAAALILSSQDPTVQRDITYSRAETREMQADFFPAPGEGKKPFVIAIHGGAWVGGKRQDMEGLAKAMQAKGLSVATVTYRLAPRSKWPAMIDDVKAAVRYFRANAEKYNIDPERVGAVGGSAGGHLALLLGFMKNDAPAGTPSAKVSAVFNIFGPVDMAQDFNPQLVNFLAPQVLGKPAADAKQDLIAFSPINFISKETMVPVYTLHGEKDATVPVEQARRLDRKMKEFGGEHTMVLIPDMGHDIPNRPEVMKAVSDGIDFLVKHLAEPKK